jgi:hypothetical protein
VCDNSQAKALQKCSDRRILVLCSAQEKAKAKDIEIDQYCTDHWVAFADVLEQGTKPSSWQTSDPSY